MIMTPNKQALKFALFTFFICSIFSFIGCYDIPLTNFEVYFYVLSGGFVFAFIGYFLSLIYYYFKNRKKITASA